MTIDESHPDAVGIPALGSSPGPAPPIGNEAIDSDDAGRSDYSGQLLSDFDYGAYSHAALVRIADEVCLQMHLLNLSFGIAVRARATDSAQATDICTKQLTGIAGVAATRIRRALNLPADAAGLAAVLNLHPLLNPAGYVVAEIAEDQAPCASLTRPLTTAPGSPCVRRHRRCRCRR